jgi:hypothetical protein
MSSPSRVRWAAIGAALAVSLGAGGIGIVNATISSGSKAVYGPISPCRLADTRPGTDNVGTKNTPIGPGQTHTFTVRGANGNCTIPTGATAIVANVTAVGPTAQSFMTIWPAGETQPNASSLNYSAGQAPFPNAVTVTLSADGKINAANKNGSVHVIIDIAGYYEDHNHDDRYDTKAQVDAKIAEAGPAQVVWVAKSGGDFTTVKAAIDSITDASASKPYLVKVAPGTYTEPNGVNLKNYVDLEGSGQTTTTITSTSSAVDNTTLNAPSGELRAEVRDLTIRNTGGDLNAVGLRVTGVTPAGALRVTDVTVTVSGGADNFGTYVESSAPILDGVTTTASGGSNNAAHTNFLANPTMTGVTAIASDGTITNRAIINFGSSPSMSDVTATATGTSNKRAVENQGSNPIMTNVTATASGGGLNFAVFNVSSSPLLTHVTASAVGGAQNIGVIENTPGFGSIIRDSTVTGSSQTVFAAAGATPRLLYSQIIGPVTPGVSCVGTYNAVFTVLNASCT